MRNSLAHPTTQEGSNDRQYRYRIAQDSFAVGGCCIGSANTLVEMLFVQKRYGVLLLRSARPAWKLKQRYLRKRPDLRSNSAIWLKGSTLCPKPPIHYCTCDCVSDAPSEIDDQRLVSVLSRPTQDRNVRTVRIKDSRTLLRLFPLAGKRISSLQAKVLPQLDSGLTIPVSTRVVAGR